MAHWGTVASNKQILQQSVVCELRNLRIVTLQGLVLNRLKKN